MKSQVRQEISEATAAAEEAAHRDHSAHHHASSGKAAVREKARAVLDALRTLAKLALRTSAAMQAATISLQTAPDAALAQVLHKRLYAWLPIMRLRCEYEKGDLSEAHCTHFSSEKRGCTACTHIVTLDQQIPKTRVWQPCLTHWRLQSILHLGAICSAGMGMEPV